MLRIVSWNVALSLRSKWHAITALTPDLAILPEVARADLESLVPDPRHRDWIGDNDRKGLGVVAFGDYALERAPRLHIGGLLACSGEADAHFLVAGHPPVQVVDRDERDASYQAKHQFFLPARISGPTPFNLLAVWALNHRNRSELAGQRDATLQAVSHYREFLGSNACTVVAGDFNHNVLWDKPRATTANFRPLLDALDALGLVSAYHHLNVQPHGQETAHTLHWRHDPATPYHVDYVFAPKALLTDASRLQVVAPGTGNPLSDHLALVLELA